MSKETKPEMTAEKLAKKWGYERTINTMGNPVTIARKDEFLTDLNSVIRGKLMEYDKFLCRTRWGGKLLSPEASVDEFLSNNQ